MVRVLGIKPLGKRELKLTMMGMGFLLSLLYSKIKEQPSISIRIYQLFHSK